MKAAQLRKRIEAVTLALAGTFAARFAKLTNVETAIYRKWRGAISSWHLQNERKPGDAYAAIMDGAAPPSLPRSIREKLFGPTPVIIAHMTADQAADAYCRFVREAK